MAAQLILLPFRPVINLQGGLESGATLDVYVTGTSTRVSIYSDAALSVELSNPLTANSAGVFPEVYFDDSTAVRVVVKRANGEVLSDTDPLIVTNASAEASADAAAASAEAAAASLASVQALVTADELPYDDYFAYSRSIWNEYENFNATGTFVDVVDGNNANAGTLAAPLQTIDYAHDNTAAGQTLILRNGQLHALSYANRNWGEGTTREAKNYGGGGATPPIIDGRLRLSGLTFTNLSGNAWETTVTFPHTLILAGVNVANSDKFALYFGAPGGASPEGTALTWYVGGANAAANETNVIANAGSFSMDIAGEGEIRAAGGSPTSAHLVVHLPDGSDPNGQDLYLSSSRTVVAFYGGEHGHLMIIGGASKDTWNTEGLGGVIPSFQSVTVIDPPCHAGVGPKNILGKFKAYGKPSPGVPIGDSDGRTLGGGCHLFTAADYSDQNIVINEFDCRNFDVGALYAHGSGNKGYNRIDVLKRSIAQNCGTALKVDGGPTGGDPFLDDGLYLHGGIDATNCDGFLSVVDDPYWYINGGSYTRDNDFSRNSSTLVNLNGAGNTVEIKDFTFAMSYPSVSPTFKTRVLFRWNPAYGTPASLVKPTLIFDNVQDETVINTSIGQRKAGFFGNVGTHPFASRAHMVLKNGTTLGDMWNGFTWTGTLPESLTMEGDCTIGFGTTDWAAFETAMQGASRSYNIKAGAKLVDGSGNLVDTASSDLVFP